MASSVLVIGSCEQFPNDLRAYHLMGTSTDGVVLLSRRGTTYSAGAGEVIAYPQLLERMLGLVLAGFPSSLRERARAALISRWNRAWGIEAEDLVESQDAGAGERLDLPYGASANDNGASPAAEAFASAHG